MKKAFLPLMTALSIGIAGCSTAQSVETESRFDPSEAQLTAADESSDLPATPEPTPEPEPEVYEASFFFTGDALLHGAVYWDAGYETRNWNFGKQLDLFNDIAEKYDLQYYNQETILGGVELGLSHYPTFNSPQEFGDYMLSRGYNLVSTATNHTLDRGEVAVLNSYNYWKSKSDQILMAGTYDSWEAQQEIPVREINGITYTMINYTYGMNGLSAPEGREYLVNCYDGHTDELVEKVRQANELADVVIVAMHWGTEYSMEANDEQRELALRLNEAGADIIVGNHPHVIQPIEWVNNTIVYYAMGNLISAQYNLENKIGMYGTVRIVKTVTGDDVKVEILEPRADLSYTFMDGNNKNIKVYPFSELNDSILPGYEEIYERFKAKINEYDDSIIVGGI